jgi:hypothetical protein
MSLVTPPNILRITRSLAKPGSRVELARARARRAEALVNARWPRPSIALTSVTGPDEVWRLTGYEAFEAWNEDLETSCRMHVLSSLLELLDQEEGDLIQESREVTAVYRPEISYRPEFDWADMRFLDVITIQLRPGHHAEYLQNRKLVMDAHQRAALDEHILIYTVSSGWRSGTYLILRPLRSLRDLDLMEEMHGKRYGEILGDDNRKRVIELFAASVEREEEEYFAVDARASHITAAWSAAESDYRLTADGQANRSMAHALGGQRPAHAIADRLSSGSGRAGT